MDHSDILATARRVAELDAKAPRHEWAAEIPPERRVDGGQTYFPSVRVGPKRDGAPWAGKFTVNEGVVRRAVGLDAYNDMAHYIAAAVNAAPALAAKLLEVGAALTERIAQHERATLMWADRGGTEEAERCRAVIRVLDDLRRRLGMGG